MTQAKEQAILIAIKPSTIYNKHPYAILKCPTCYKQVVHTTPYNIEDYGDRVAMCSYRGKMKYCPEYTLPSKLINHILTNYRHKLDNNKSVSLRQINEINQE